MILGRSDMSEFNDAVLLKVGEKGNPLSSVVMPLNCHPPTTAPATR